ncbi:hypothetical protein QJS04_geneDACA010113 [Acorus gramineus]|uniref:RING-type domain-containing protein n=1 Tax=Acorus gramineus TaxID=55184 RepID=A0AAV9BEP6_ACOGR|nr:hypothetical protein QJS04_geneDACA010113 [Acorus gramineus]
MECVICLEDLRIGDRCRILPNCRHEFHDPCIVRWLKTRAVTCPICRASAQVQHVNDSIV